MSKKFIVKLPATAAGHPQYFINFWNHCKEISLRHGWNVDTVVNCKLKPLGGRFIFTKTQGSYLRWDTEAAHTAFVLRWT